MTCRTHYGKHGGKFIMKRKKGGGVKRVYFKGKKPK